MISNMVHSYDKNTKVAMVACTPQPVTSRGSNNFDKDSRRTIELPWKPYTLEHMDIPWLPRVYEYCPCGSIFDPLHKYIYKVYKTFSKNVEGCRDGRA